MCIITFHFFCNVFLTSQRILFRGVFSQTIFYIPSVPPSSNKAYNIKIVARYCVYISQQGVGKKREQFYREDSPHKTLSNVKNINNHVATERPSCTMASKKKLFTFEILNSSFIHFLRYVVWMCIIYFTNMKKILLCFVHVICRHSRLSIISFFFYKFSLSLPYIFFLFPPKRVKNKVCEL